MKGYVVFMLGIAMSISAVSAQDRIPKWITDGPYLENTVAAFEAPIHMIATKMYVEVNVGGKARRFVFDTGSPSMLDESLAQELGLNVVGQSKGTDSHGMVIESDIVQATMDLDGVIFHNVPMFVADFSGSPVTKCLIGDGVLGSELLPLGAWQMDVSNSVLRFNTNVTQLPFISEATQTQLYNFGYPHSPILDVRFAKKATSKAMFDTGSPAYFVLSENDYNGAKKAKGIGQVIAGYGSPGASLGGQAPMSHQLQVELKKLSIDNVDLGRVSAVHRELSPSLIGAGILKHFIVTLDPINETAYFEKYTDGLFAYPSFGFTLAFDQKITVATVWDDSPAQKAGIEAGLHLTSINGIQTELSCEGIQRSIEAMEASEIHLEWSDGSTTLSRKSHLLR